MGLQQLPFDYTLLRPVDIRSVRKMLLCREQWTRQRNQISVTGRVDHLLNYLDLLGAKIIGNHWISSWPEILQKSDSEFGIQPYIGVIICSDTRCLDVQSIPRIFQSAGLQFSYRLDPDSHFQHVDPQHCYLATVSGTVNICLRFSRAVLSWLCRRFSSLTYKSSILEYICTALYVHWPT